MLSCKVQLQDFRSLLGNSQTDSSHPLPLLFCRGLLGRLGIKPLVDVADAASPVRGKLQAVRWTSYSVLPTSYSVLFLLPRHSPGEVGSTKESCKKVLGDGNADMEAVGSSGSSSEPLCAVLGDDHIKLVGPLPVVELEARGHRRVAPGVSK